MAHRRYKVDLAAHMAECDANYARLHQLLPELFDRDERTLSLTLPQVADRVLRFRVVERCPYTTTLALDFTRAASDWHPLVPAPRLLVRLYHDARTAEVTAYQGEDRFQGRYDYPNGRMHQPDEKAQLNRFLGEYLALCLAHGREPAPVAVNGRRA
ncbi:MAG: DUF1249 domain-containing protein [Gammaproteobacteria bacterium]|nr:MAG: DUF1249 domain-containing protein [Gammaproteobacteria bacterium]